MTHIQKFALVIALSSLTVFSGIILGKTGRPYSSGLFNLHKLISVGAIVLTVLITRTLLLTGGATPLLIAAVSFAFAAFAVLLATGALLSIKAEPADWIFLVHRAAPVIVCLASAVLLVLFRMQILQQS